MIRALVCDLDNTLFATAAMPRAILRPVHDALRDAAATWGGLPAVTIDRAIEESWHRPFDAIAEEYRFPERLRAAWVDANAMLTVSVALEPYPDVQSLGLLPLARFLVTTGFRRFQESKIQALGIAPLFHGIYVDTVDASTREGKVGIFRRILREHDLGPGEVLVVGDSAESELAAGAQLGMVTVQVLRPGVVRSHVARHHIDDLRQLTELASMDDEARRP